MNQDGRTYLLIQTTVIRSTAYMAKALAHWEGPVASDD